MNNLSGYHQYLLMGKVTQTLTDEETRELEILLDNDVELQEAYKDAISKIPANWIENGLDHIKQPDYWIDLKTKLSHPTYMQRRIGWTTWLSAAAIVTSVLLGGWWLLTEKNSRADKRPSVAQSSNSVQLKLANGKVIDLTHQKGNIETSSGNFLNDDNALTYTATAAKTTGTNSILVPAAMNYKIVLSDGSKIFLNSLSELQFPSAFSDKSREITINGEAYLEVAKNPAKPFIVHLPGTTVKVLGTEFNVNSYDSGVTRISLVIGSVNIEAPAQSVRLSPGKEAINYFGKGIIQQDFDAKKVLAWKQGLYYYDGITLKELSKILERWFSVKAVIDDPALYKKVFVGVIDKNQPLETFLEDIEAISKIKSYFDKDGVLHFK